MEKFVEVKRAPLKSNEEMMQQMMRENCVSIPNVTLHSLQFQSPFSYREFRLTFITRIYRNHKRQQLHFTFNQQETRERDWKRGHIFDESFATVFLLPVHCLKKFD